MFIEYRSNQIPKAPEGRHVKACLNQGLTDDAEENKNKPPKSPNPPSPPYQGGIGEAFSNGGADRGGEGTSPNGLGDPTPTKTISQVARL